MNQLVNAIWAQYLKLHRYKINRFSEQPHESQEEELMSILDTAKYTEWGQKYHFADVLTANGDSDCLFKTMKVSKLIFLE